MDGVHYSDVLILFAWAAVLTTRAHVPGAVYYFFNSNAGKENGVLHEEFETFGFPPIFRAMERRVPAENGEETDGGEEKKTSELVILPWRRIKQDIDANEVLSTTPGIGWMWQIGAMLRATLLSVSLMLATRTDAVYDKVVAYAILVAIYVALRESYGIYRECLVPSRTSKRHEEQDALILLLMKLSADATLLVYTIMAREHTKAAALGGTAFLFSFIWHVFCYTRYHF